METTGLSYGEWSQKRPECGLVEGEFADLGVDEYREWELAKKNEF